MGTADNVILNIYPHSYDSIPPHTDWNEWVVGLSLTSDVTMDFYRRGCGKAEKVRISARSLYVLTGEARYEYMHGIAAQELNLRSRVSLTFRTIQSKWLPAELRFAAACNISSKSKNYTCQNLCCIFDH